MIYLSERVLEAEKLVHGKVIARSGKEAFDKAMKEPYYQNEIDKTVLQAAGCVLPEEMLDGD